MSKAHAPSSPVKRSESTSTSLFEFNSRPSLAKALPLGLQHLLAAIAGIITPPIIVAGVIGASVSDRLLLIQAAILASGICTIFHLYGVWKLGARVPALFGVGFAYVPTLIAVGSQYGIEGIMGAQLIGGIFMMVIGYFIQYIRHLFPPVVAGTVVLVIGLSLYDVAIRYMAGSGNINAEGFGDLSNWIVGFSTMLAVLIAAQFGKGVFKLSAVIIGIVFGYLIALPMGMVDFSNVGSATAIAIPAFMPFKMEFHAAAITSMVVICVINSVQTIGDLSATTVGGMNRELKTKELTGGLLGNGLTTAVSAFFAAMPTSTFSQNVGIVAMTKVISRFVLAITGAFLIVAGLSPKFSALITTIPLPVLGGATIAVFGMISLTGIQLLIKDELSSRNMTIVGLALALSMGISSVPQATEQFPEFLKNIIGGSPIVVAALVAFTLNMLLPKKSLADEAEERRAIEVAEKERCDRIKAIEEAKIAAEKAGSH